MANQVQASRLIPAHIFAGMGEDKYVKVEGSNVDLVSV
jgi:hypothetical protein